MKIYLLWLPFLSLAILAGGVLLHSSYFTYPAVLYITLFISIGLTVSWIFLDWFSIKEFFFRRGVKYGAASGSVLLTGFVIFLSLVMLTNRDRFNKKIDFTTEGIYTLSSDTLKIIKLLKSSESQVFITVYTKDTTSQEHIRRLLFLYQEAGSDFKVEYLDPFVHATRAKADKVSSSNTLLLRFNKEETVIYHFTEEKITNALLYLIKPRTKNICFTSNHGEASLNSEDLQGLKRLASKLKGLRYNLFEVTLEDKQKLLDQCKLIVSVGPHLNFSIEETNILEAYLNAGNSYVAMIDAMRPVDTLNKLLQKYGIEYNNDFIVLSSEDQRISLFGQNSAIIDQFDQSHPVSRNLGNQEYFSLEIPESRSLLVDSKNLPEIKVRVLAKTSNTNLQIPEIYTLEDLNDVDSKYLRKVALPFAVLSEKSLPSSSKADAPKEARVIGLGSSQLCVNQGFEKKSNQDFVLNVLSYLLRDEDYISINPKEFQSQGLSLKTSNDVYALMLICFIYPFLFLLSGVYFWMRKKQG